MHGLASPTTCLYTPTPHSAAALCMTVDTSACNFLSGSHASMSTAVSCGWPMSITACYCCMGMSSAVPCCISGAAVKGSEGSPISACGWAGGWAWAMPGTASTGSNSTGKRVTLGLSARMLLDNLREISQRSVVSIQSCSIAAGAQCFSVCCIVNIDQLVQGCISSVQTSRGLYGW